MSNVSDSTIRDRANESAKKAKQFSPSVQYAITVAVPNMSNGAFWGFTSLDGVKLHIDAIKNEPNLTARKLGNACLIEVNPSYLLQAVQAIDPNALRQQDIDDIKTSMAEAVISFEKFLIAKGKQAVSNPFSGTIGVYCVNNVTTINFRGTSYPAFRVSISQALSLLAQYGYSICVGGKFIPAAQAAQAGDALWNAMTLSPTKTGVFIDIKSTYTPDQYKQLEQQFKAKYGVK